MAVYIVTAHAYRSWREDDPKNYVQRGEGLKGPSEGMAAWRAGMAGDDEARFEAGAQQVLHRVAVGIAKEKAVTLHACATCPTHVHVLLSFRSPACECAGSDHCGSGCPARKRVEDVIARMKRKMGVEVAKHEGTRGRKWFSRGWDITRVRRREHFDYLVTEYLPDHEATQAGIYRRHA